MEYEEQNIIECDAMIVTPEMQKNFVRLQGLLTLWEI